MDSEVLSGQPSSVSERVMNTTQFMDSLQGLILEKARLDRDEAETRYNVTMTQMLPHVRYSARLFHDGLQWVCSWGIEPNSQLVARGDNPNEALQNFDMAWFGQQHRVEGGPDEPDPV